MSLAHTSHAALELELRDARVEHDEALEQLRIAVARRREVLQRASAAGMSRRAVAEGLGLTPGRVQQILDES